MVEIPLAVPKLQMNVGRCSAGQEEGRGRGWHAARPAGVGCVLWEAIRDDGEGLLAAEKSGAMEKGGGIGARGDRESCNVCYAKTDFQKELAEVFPLHPWS